MRFNGDTTANYAWTRGAFASAYVQQTATGANQIGAWYISGNTATALLSGIGRIFIPNYSGTIFLKTVLLNWLYQTGLGAGAQEGDQNTGVYNNTAGGPVTSAPINRIDLFTVANNFMANSLFTLYGIP
jgi:hypothetical protein